jgi:CHAT domain-containing protein
VPFEALPIPGRRNYTPLLAEHEVVMLPSASVLSTLRAQTNGRETLRDRLMILADPVYSSDDARVRASKERSATPRSQPLQSESVLPPGTDFAQAVPAVRDVGLPGAGYKLPRIPGTRLEARRIVALAPKGAARVALDFEASQATVMSGALRDARLVHFATHGLLNPERPELSGLVLTLVNEKGEPQDGYLSVPEIFNLDLSADLVVLSGCETALGKNVRGEGLVGLTRAFMYAGSPRVVASLWAVRDDATAELMSRFYAGMLKRKLRPAAALREAQLSMWREPRWRSPLNWAAFVFQGEWR